jgi:hypothetical protein
MALFEIILGFLLSLLISAIIIYVATKLFGESEGIGTAVLTAFLGAIIFAVAGSFGIGWIAALIAGIVWLLAIGSMYKVGWIKSFLIAVIIWIFATIVSYILPTIAGPL